MKKINLGNNWTGAQTVIHVNDDELISRDVQNVTPILDQNKELRKLGRHPNRQTRGRHVGSIPITAWNEWRKSWKQNYSQDWTWQTFLTMKLNSRDYREFKTNDMKL